jgi:hypothetical protein
MQHYAVADMAIDFDNAVLAGKCMCHAGILQVRALLHDDTPEIPPQNGIRADITTVRDDHVTDKDCGLVDKGAGVNNRHESFNTINGHLRLT